MYHTNCMSGYLLQFERDTSRINEIRNELDEDSSDILSTGVEDLCGSLELATKGYTLSECRDSINKKLDDAGKKFTITNRRLKEYLIKKYSRLAFLARIESQNRRCFFRLIFIKINWSRKTEVVSECAKMLRRETKDYDFQLNTSYCDANDIALSLATVE